MPPAVYAIWASLPTDRLEAARRALDTVANIRLAENSAAGGSETRIGLQVSAADIDKGTAARRLLGMIGTDPSRVMAIGDAENDLPMFRVVGTAIAMGNAPTVVQEQASHVVQPLARDGFAQAIHEFALEAQPWRTNLAA